MTFPSQSKYILIGQETTWATGGTADKDVGLIVNSISHNTSREVKESTGISTIQTQKITGGIYSGGFNLTGDFQHGRLLSFILGTVAHDATSTPDIKHTFTINNNPPSLLAEIGNDLTTDTVFDYTGQIVESADLSIALNGVLQLSTTFTGKQPTSGSTASSAVTSTLETFPHEDVTVTINGTPATECQNASISFKKIVNKSGGISSNDWQQAHATELKFSFKATLGFTATTYHDLLINGTSFEFKIQADNSVTAGSGRREISVTLENCLSNNFDESTSVGDLIFVDIEGVGTLKECFTYDNITSVNWL